MVRRNNLLGARRSRHGFTLVEIILVVVIILSLAAVVGPKLIGQGRKSKINMTKITMNNIKQGLGMFEMHAGRLPTSEEGLEALIKKPASLSDDQWAGPYVDKAIKDGFNRDFEYRQPSQHGNDYDLVSGGPDTTIGTEDDITNINESGTAG